jgi:hypothetical protein
VISFVATIEKFGEKGEKTGWTYILVPSELAQQLHPGVRKAFRIKGKIDQHPFSLVSLLPMGDGDFIMTLNAKMRKAIKKQKGAKVSVRMEVDPGEIVPPKSLLECLADEPKARENFQKLPMSRRNYFINWIRAAKTDPTIAKRIAATINALEKGWDFGQMLRAMKKDT